MSEKPKKFNPYCVQVARESRGMDIPELSELTAIGSNILPLFENGAVEPSIAEIQKLATALNYPVTFFYQSDFKKLTQQMHNGYFVGWHPPQEPEPEKIDFLSMATAFFIGLCPLHKERVYLEAREQMNGSTLWVLKMGSYVMRKSQEIYWILEPNPSSRSEAFIKNTRFNSYQEAYAFWLKIKENSLL